MNPARKKIITRPRCLVVDWQDSVWFPPVLAQHRFAGVRAQRRPVFWPLQIITDPTVCVGRTL